MESADLASVMQTWTGDEIMRYLSPLDILRFKGQPTLHSAALRYASRYGTYQLLEIALEPPRRSMRWPALAIACLSSKALAADRTDYRNELSILSENFLCDDNVRPIMKWRLTGGPMRGNAEYLRAVLSMGQISFKAVVDILIQTGALHCSPELVQVIVHHPPFRQRLLEETEYDSSVDETALIGDIRRSDRGEPRCRMIDHIAQRIVTSRMMMRDKAKRGELITASLRHCFDLSGTLSRRTWYVLMAGCSNKSTEDYIWSIRDACLGPPSLVSGSSGSCMRYIRCLDAVVNVQSLILHLVRSDKSTIVCEILADPGAHDLMPSASTCKCAIVIGNITIMRALFEAALRVSNEQSRRMPHRWIDGTLIREAIKFSHCHHNRYSRGQLITECIRLMRLLPGGNKHAKLSRVIHPTGDCITQPDTIHALLTSLAPFDRHDLVSLTWLRACGYKSVFRRISAVLLFQLPHLSAHAFTQPTYVGQFLWYSCRFLRKRAILRIWQWYVELDPFFRCLQRPDTSDVAINFVPIFSRNRSTGETWVMYTIREAMLRKKEAVAVRILFDVYNAARVRVKRLTQYEAESVMNEVRACVWTMASSAVESKRHYAYMAVLRFFGEAIERDGLLRSSLQLPEWLSAYFNKKLGSLMEHIVAGGLVKWMRSLKAFMERWLPADIRYAIATRCSKCLRLHWWDMSSRTKSFTCLGILHSIEYGALPQMPSMSPDQCGTGRRACVTVEEANAHMTSH